MSIYHTIEAVEKLSSENASVSMAMMDILRKILDSTEEERTSALMRRLNMMQGDIDHLANSLEMLGSNRINSFSSEIDSIKEELRIAGSNRLINSFSSEIDSIKEELTVVGAHSQHNSLYPEVTSIRGALEGLGSSLQKNAAHIERSIGLALGDDMVMVLESGTAAEDIAVGDLNGAAAGTLIREFTLLLEAADGTRHTWSQMQPTVTPAEAVADVDVAAPSVTMKGTATPKYVNGCLFLVVTFDTDVNVTKTYVIGESMTVTIDITAFPISAGVTNFVKTYDVVA